MEATKPGSWYSNNDFARRIQANVHQCLGTLTHMNLVPEQCQFQRSSQALLVTAIVGFAGNYQGLLSLHCPEALAWRITEAMLGTSPSSDDVSDAIGEVANIIGGKVKEVLAPGGMEVALSIPAVFQGEGMFFPDPIKDRESFCCSFQYGGERLLVALKMKRMA